MSTFTFNMHTGILEEIWKIECRKKMFKTEIKTNSHLSEVKRKTPETCQYVSD